MAETGAPAGIALDRGGRSWTLAASACCVLPLLLQLPPELALGVAAVGIAMPVIAREGRTPGWLRLLLVVALLGTVLLRYRFGFGRDTGCALLATMLALKPSELRTVRDARSLIGFGLFAPFATFLLDQGPTSLTLGLIGAVAALTALLKLSEAESGQRDAGGDTRTMAGAQWRRVARVARMIAIGLPVALAAFWLFPRLASPIWGVPDRALSRPGLSDHMSPGDWVDLIGDDSPALRATFHGAEPRVEDMYWRGPVLWDFDGRGWRGLDWPAELPRAPMTPGKRRYRYDLEVEPTDRTQMVALELPIAIPDSLHATPDYSLRAPRPLSSLTRWEMQSAAPAQFEPTLHPLLRRLSLQLPPGFNPRAVALARQWRREAGNGSAADGAIVNRMIRWIRAEFAYTLEVPPMGRHTIDEFLFERRAGYCEHFSSSFVVMMRAAGIPARVVTGYVGGYRNPLGNYWLVRRSDAHAWAEVWIAPRGWVRIDPTAAVAPERIYDTIDDRTPGALGGFGGLTPVFNLGDWLRRGWNDFVLGFNATRQRQLLSSLGMPDLDAGRLVVLFILATTLALGGMYWLTTRQERERDPVLRAWRRLERRYRRLGLARARHEPAGAWAQRVATARPGTGATDGPLSLLSLSARFSDWRYARGHGAPGNTQDADVTKRRDALVRDLRRHRP